MMRLYGARGITVTLSTFASMVSGDTTTLASSLLAPVPAFLVDGWIMYQVMGAGNACAHAIFAAPFIALIGTIHRWW